MSDVSISPRKRHGSRCNVYEGKVTPAGPEVTVNGRPLDWRLDISNHSPTGLAWGYEGSGPAQAALAILCYELGLFEGSNPVLYQEFKRGVIAALPVNENFELTSRDISDWMSANPLAANQ